MKRYALGVDLGGTNVKIGLVSQRDGRIKAKRILPTKRYKDKGALIDAIIDEASSLLSKRRVKRREVAGIGLGLPGLIDSQKGIVHCLVNVRGWKDVPLKKILERKLKLSTFIDNDVNVVALGELLYGAGKGAQNMLCITLGTGVGGGIIVDGRLYRGSSLAAGEIGHITINEGGPRCKCGNRGCVEAYVGNRYIISSAKKRLKSGAKSMVSKLVNGNFEKLSPEILELAARRGDKFSKAIWAEAGKHLGVALAGVINLLNPELVVVGGGVAKAGELLFKPLRKSIRVRAMSIPFKRVRIVRAKLGEDAGIIGAAALTVASR